MNREDREGLLEDAIRDAVASQAAQTKPVPPAPRNGRWEGPLVVAILCGWAFIAWVWLAEPAFIFGAPEEPVATVEHREAALRYAVYLRHADVAAFVRDSGRVPSSLAEVPGETDAAIILEQDATGAWAIVGHDQELSVRLAEGMSPDSFLGTSLTVLQAAATTRNQ